MKITYLMPVTLFILLAVFFLGLPRLRTCELPGRAGCAKRLDRIDAGIMALISLLYAAIAFTGLGNTESPQTFAAMENASAVVELPGDEYPSRIMLFSGVGEGSYSFEFSQDGVLWEAAGEYKQDYVSVFKWNELYLSATCVPRYVKISGTGPVYLGEAAFIDGDGELIPAIGAGAAQLITDEQDCVPDKQTFLNSSYFDEIYHARTAWENLNGVYPYEISHPPLGKLIIALGVSIFGMSPFGWRFMGTLFGVLMLPILYVFLKRLTRSSAITACATIIFAFDFMHFVQTRIATIDTYAVFFILLMYLFMWRFVSSGKWRYLALSGIFFGIGAASKWTCIYAGAGLAVIWLVYWITQGRKPRFASRFFSNCAFCLVFFVAIPLAIYYASYYHYGTASGLEGGVGMYFTRDYFDIVWDNQVYMWEYHSDLVSTHPYSSRWYQWLVDARPILYYLEYFPDGTTKSAFGAFLNPIFCWAGLLAVIANAVFAFRDRDGRAAFIVIGYLAQLLPWVLVTRLTFAYHYFPSEVFMLLALANVWLRMKEQGLFRWERNMYAVTGVSAALFVAYYPVLTGLRCALWYTRGFLRWFPSWPF